VLYKATTEEQAAYAKAARKKSEKYAKNAEAVKKKSYKEERNSTRARVSGEVYENKEADDVVISKRKLTSEEVKAQIAAFPPQSPPPPSPPSPSQLKRLQKYQTRKKLLLLQCYLC
jgi:hypothetical protein